MHHSGIKEKTLEEVMGDRFGRYSKYIIQERALPDIRDGLKPVQRRILYAMFLDGNTSDKGFRKSAKAVGNIMGNYHPHGDSSIYEAMVRMSQDWKLREPLIEMHGNNGSMDGDPAAAMRYTEARLSALSSELLTEIDKETVDMVWNFDDTAKEPTVLPAKFPNLLINGSTGISAGYATEIPTHNLKEVIEGLIYLLKHPEATVDELMNYIPGPDFPTGGILMGKEQLKKAYETGKGKVILRAKTAIEKGKGNRTQIVVTEIPYEVNKANLVKKIDEIRLQKKIDGIVEVRDETDRTGLRIVVELKKDAEAENILNYLFKNTDLQINYHFNMVAIDHQRPVQVGLKRILSAYIEHRKEVIYKRTAFDHEKKAHRLHIVEGLIRALSILDEIIAMIRGSKNRKEAQEHLVTDFSFTKVQAEAIIVMPLYRLTNTDVTTLEKEQKQLTKELQQLEKIMQDEKELEKVLVKEWKQIIKEYASERKTKIEAEVAELTITEEQLIPSENTMVAITKNGYLKRSSLRSVQSSGGVTACGKREEDDFIFIGEANTRDILYLLTNKGKMIYRPVYEVIDTKWKEVGDHITESISNLEEEEEIQYVFHFSSLPTEEQLLFITRQGLVKQMSWEELRPWRTYRTKAQICYKWKEENESFLWVTSLPQQKNFTLYLFTHLGYSLAYPTTEITLTKAKASGIKAINLKDGDYLVSAFVMEDEGILSTTLVTVTQRGAMKQMPLLEIPIQKRAQRGILVLKKIKSQPHFLVYAAPIQENEVVTYETKNGYIAKVEVENIRNHQRESNGTIMIDEKVEGEIISAQVLPQNEAEEII